MPPLQIAKSTTIAGQDVDLTLSKEKFGRGGSTAVTAKTNVDKVGDVTVTLGQRGNKSAFDGDGALANDIARVHVNLPVSDINKDLTASVDYDLNNKDANVRVGYSSGDIAVRLKTAIDSNQKLSHTVNADYSGIEGVGIALEVDDSGSGKVNITKDKYELEVPVSKNGVNKDDIKLTYSWSMNM